MTATTMTPEIRDRIAAADLDPDAMTFVPRTAIHPFALSCDAWLDTEIGTLIFIDATPDQQRKFMYYIGEEANAMVVAARRGMVAFEVSGDRVDWIVRHVEDAKPAT